MNFPHFNEKFDNKLYIIIYICVSLHRSTYVSPNRFTFMAIVENFWLKDQRKRLAGAVIYQAMGQTRSRRLAETISNPRTESQMTQRVKWSNLVNLYRANRSWMKYAYETKKQTQSEYNKFMSLNVTSSPIYLPKQVAGAGGCVVAPYQITQGSLPSIEVVRTQDWWQTNIVLPDDTQWQPSWTIAQFTQMVLPLNPGIREGDQLSFVRMTQQVNADNGVPFVIVREYEMIFDSTSQELVSKYLPLAYFSSSEQPSDCRLVIVDSGQAGGFVLILSRTIGGKTFVSSQKIVVANNDTLINFYSSAAALQAAIDSYGESQDAFLSSTTAAAGPVAPSPVSIVSINGALGDHVPGSRWEVSGAAESNIISAVLNDDSLSSADKISVVYWKNGTRIVLEETDLRLSGNTVTTTLTVTPSAFNGSVIEAVLIYTGSVVIRADFLVTEADKQGGLE